METVINKLSVVHAVAQQIQNGTKSKNNISKSEHDALEKFVFKEKWRGQNTIMCLMCSCMEPSLLTLIPIHAST